MSPAITAFIHDTTAADLPPEVLAQARRCLLDTLGVAAGGLATDLSRIIRNHAARHFGSAGAGAPMLFDGRPVSPVGAALAGGMTIDSLDAHDGHVLTKGHGGAAVVPALIALAQATGEGDGRAFLTALVIGYEIALRAGIALHASACDYHTSGAWNALGCAAVGARALQLDAAATREALGIAEYHGPRSPMMRCIDHPTMVKDGSGWGAMAGVSAAYLAADGFTGAPALTIEDPELAYLWSDLGRRWRILEQYFKPYPVCRWAQPAVEAALGLQSHHGVAAGDIRQVAVVSFHKAVRLATRRPASTEQAQYSLPFAVASALVHGRLGATEVANSALADPAVQGMAETMTLTEADTYNDRFPEERWAHVRFDLKGGQVLESAPAIARGNPDNPLSDGEIRSKFHALAGPALGSRRAAALASAVDQLASPGSPLSSLLITVTPAI